MEVTDSSDTEGVQHNFYCVFGNLAIITRCQAGTVLSIIKCVGPCK